MNGSKPSRRAMSESALDELVLSEFPLPIAVNYRELLEAEGWQARTLKCVEVFRFGLRAVTLGVLSQYCLRDASHVNDPELDGELYRKLPSASDGTWVDFLFRALAAYGGKRDLFFMPELYDMYWHTTATGKARRRKKAREPFDRLVSIRNDLFHRLPPKDEEGWQALHAEAMDHLRAILYEFRFLRHHDLIRVLEDHGDRYTIEKFTGQEITIDSRPAGYQPQRLRVNWFYLARHDGAVLELHPLMVLWMAEPGSRPSAERERDVAVFERLHKDYVEYMALVAWHQFREFDPQLIALFEELLQSAWERWTRVGRAADLSWAALRQAAGRLTTERMASVQSRYRRKLYLQRAGVLHEFQTFLESDAVCFVLTGKSGVGKSNFALSLLDEPAYGGSDDICLLIYNGARLTVEGTAADAVGQDLRRQLGLAEDALRDPIAELAEREDLSGKTFIIVYDAINENKNGRELLAKVDDMVARNPYPWLKVVITSRPQAWRTLKRGLTLARERYYRGKETDEYWVELGEFSVQLEPFERDELPEAYAKYKKEYDLQSEYLDLGLAVRSALQDPLILRLVAEIYRGGIIPPEIRASDIYDQYVEFLLASGQLAHQDIDFLRKDLMPLMISEGCFDNRITRSQVAEAHARDGRPLGELIENADLLSTGQPVNASYQRLVDHGLLTQLGSPIDYQIAFNYERFYDDFGADRLRELMADRQGVASRVEAYRGFVDAIQNPRRRHPYLWGPVHNALVSDLKDGSIPSGLIIELAQTVDQLTKDLIVSALTAYGRDGDSERFKVTDICLELLELGRADHEGMLLSAARRILPGRKPRTSVPMADMAQSYMEAATASQVHMAKKAAVEAACHLQLGTVLEQAAYDPVPAARAVAVQYIYYLWRDDMEKGFALLSDISQNIPGRWLIPNLRALESCLAVSLMIIFWHYQDLENRMRYFQRLQAIWKRPIEHILAVREGEKGIVAGAKDLARRGILRLVVKLAVSIAQRAEESGVMFGLDDISSFFPANEARLQLFQRLVPHMDAVHGGTDSILCLQDDLLGLMDDRDMLTTYLVFAVIVAHAIGDPEPALELVKQMFDRGIESPPPPVIEGASAAVPMMVILVWAPRNALYGRRFTGEGFGEGAVSEEMLALLGSFIKRFGDRFGSRCSTSKREYRFIELPSYTYFHFLTHRDAHSELLDQALEHAVATHDRDALVRDITGLSLVGSHPAWGVPEAALQGLHVLLQKLHQATDRDQWDPEGRIEQVLILAFSNLRAYHPDAVDDFLAEVDNDVLSTATKRRIQSRGAAESLGMLLGTAAAWFARDVIIDENPHMRELLKWLLLQAASCRSIDQWMGLLVQRTINLAYGKPVFRLHT